MADAAINTRVAIGKNRWLLMAGLTGVMPVPFVQAIANRGHGDEAVIDS